MSISGGIQFFKVGIFDCICCVFFKVLISDLILFVCRFAFNIFDTIFFKVDIFHLSLTQTFARICSPGRTRNQGIFQGFGLAAFPVVCHVMKNFCLEGFVVHSNVC